MATISVKLKIIADKDTKKKVLESHKLFNKYVKMFEEFLLLAQGKDYYYKDDNGEERYKSKEDVAREMREYLHKRGLASNDYECIEALKGLAAVVSEKKSMAAGMLAKFYKADSTAGMNNIKKIVDPVPEWVEHYRNNGFDDDKYKKMADDWIESEEGRKAIAPILNGSGRPSAFKNAYKNGMEWYSKFIKDQKTYRKDLDNGLSKILFVLNKENAFPLIDIDESLVKNHPVWVKLMLKTALENYASYLASDDDTRNNYKLALNEFEAAEKKVKSDYSQQLSAVQNYLEDNYIQTDRSVYLTQRMCRGIDEINREWKNKNNYTDRIAVINEWQSDDKKKRILGDVNFLRWLAEEDHINILESDCLESLIKYYECLRKVELRKKCASYTVADPVSSKRYLFYEAEGGTNYREYRLESDGTHIKAIFPILLGDEKNSYYEETVTVKLAGSKQFQNVKLLGKRKVEFNNDKDYYCQKEGIVNKEFFKGELGGSDLRVETTDTGKLVGLYINLTINVDDFCEADQKQMALNAMYAFSRAYDGKVSKKYDESLSGKTIRALAIDLGLKQFCACAVGSVKYGENLIDLPDIAFERKFLLKMQGDKITSKEEQYRREAMKELSEIRKEINYILLLKRIYNQDTPGREKILKQSAKYYKHPEKEQLFQYCLNVEDAKKVEECLSDEYSRMIADMNLKMKEFRSGNKTKKQKREYNPGKSYWSINYLEQLRKVLMSWNSLGYRITDENKPMNRSYGVTATRLLDHIQNLKEDRIKTGADLIIQAARGFQYDEEKGYWVQKYDPCHIIIFEDLSRYQFSTDRPKKENSKLMKWSHREIVNEVIRQASIYGIAVYDSTDASYSSKYCYKSDTPGIRCDKLGKNDFEASGRLRTYIYDNLPEKIREKAELLKPGSLVPSEIGSVFVTVDKDGRLYCLNADLNAACNLLKRFFGMHTHLIRFPTININGYLFLKGVDCGDITDENQNIGKRFEGKLNKYFGTKKVMLKASSCSGHFRIAPKRKKAENPYVGKEKVYNLFRDPSSYIIPCDEWVGYKEFWNIVNDRIVGRLLELL